MKRPFTRYSILLVVFLVASCQQQPAPPPPPADDAQQKVTEQASIIEEVTSKSSPIPFESMKPLSLNPIEVLEALDPHTQSAIKQLTKSPSPNLVKTYDIGEPTNYIGDFPWQILPKLKKFGFPGQGCLGVLNTNTELQTMISISEDTPHWQTTSAPLLHVANVWCQPVKTKSGITGTVTYTPYDSSTLMTFVRLHNPGTQPVTVTISQLLLKEVFGSEQLYRLYPRRNSGDPMFWVATHQLADQFQRPDGDGMVFYEIEQIPPGELSAVGYLLAFMGAHQAATEQTIETLKAVDAPPPNAPAPNQSVVHRGMRTYQLTIAPGKEEQLVLHLGLQRFGPRDILYPRGVKPYLVGDYEDALAVVRKRIEAAYHTDWQALVAASLSYYTRHPVISLPEKNWDECFHATLNLPRTATLSPYGTMPIPYYNFVRAWGNDYRYWYSYGEHAHESLSVFVTALTDPLLAQTHLRGHYVNQDTRGSFPYGVNQQTKPDLRSFAEQAVTCPFLCWEAWNTYLWSGDKEFLQETYERFQKDYAWWMRDRDRNRDGLVHWIDFGETVRDDGYNPTWHYKPDDPNAYRIETPQGKTMSLGLAPVIYQEALDLNCYLMNYERVMAEIAAELGDTEGVEKFQRAWERRARTMNAYMYDSDDHLYYGITEINEVMVKTKDISTLMPLWAGLAPMDRALPLLEIYKDPSEFFTDYPVPSLAVSDPIYTPDGHWEGSGWVEMTWLVVLGLKNYGYYQEAAWLAHNQCEMVFNELLQTGYFREFWDPESGKGLGLYDYIWAAMPGIFVVDVFYGVRPIRQGVEIMPALPEGWDEISINQIQLRQARLNITVKRTDRIPDTRVMVNGRQWHETIGNRGILIPWEQIRGDINIVVEQPHKIEEIYAPPYPLPDDLLAPMPPRRYVEPTIEELTYNPRFLHNSHEAVPLEEPPRGNRLDSE